jgi:CRP/FNR family transcriptional regulator, nitrogen oxide reductase regulator
MVASFNLRPDPSVLTGVPLFAGLDAAAREDAVAAAHVRRIAAGDPVFEQGAQASAFFVLLDGHVKAVQTTSAGQQVVVHVVKPGEFFGCVALMGETHYPATALAVQESLALTWDLAALKGLVERHPRVATNALAGMGARMRDMRAQFSEVATERVERRIAHALLRLAHQSGRKIANGVEIDFPLTRQDIAEMTGATLHTVSRTLAKWEAEGILDGGRRRIVICEPHRLVAIADELAEH